MYFMFYQKENLNLNSLSKHHQMARYSPLNFLSAKIVIIKSIYNLAVYLVTN